MGWRYRARKKEVEVEVRELGSGGHGRARETGFGIDWSERRREEAWACGANDERDPCMNETRQNEVASITTSLCLQTYPSISPEVSSQHTSAASLRARMYGNDEITRRAALAPDHLSDDNVQEKTAFTIKPKQTLSHDDQPLSIAHRLYHKRYAIKVWWSSPGTKPKR